MRKKEIVVGQFEYKVTKRGYRVYDGYSGWASWLDKIEKAGWSGVRLNVVLKVAKQAPDGE